MSEEISDKQLAGLVAGGQKDYFAEIITRFERRVFATVRKYIYSAFGRALEQEAADLMQEIWIKVFKSLENYDPGRADLGTFIYRITETRCMDYMRSKWKKRLQNTEFDADIPERCGMEEDSGGRYLSTDYRTDPVKYYAVKKEMKNIFRRIDDFPELMRNLLVLRFVANVSEKEIAAQRGCTVSSVRSNVTRACKMLVASLSDSANPQEVVKILSKGTFVFTEREVKRIKDPGVKKFLELMNVRRAPLGKIFRTMKCSTEKARQELLDRVVDEILKFQRMRAAKNLPPEKLVGALFAAARKMINTGQLQGAFSPGSEILRSAGKKKISIDRLKDMLGLTASEMIKLTSGRLDISKNPALTGRITRQLGIPLSHLRATATDRLLLSLRDRKSEGILLEKIRKRVLGKLRIKQV